MLKVKKIKLSGFRGMLKPHDLDLTNKGANTPCSLVLYGMNSSGKTSFVDGLEWFLSQNNEIEWLNRADAKARAYPHQEAKEGESFVEIDFFDSEKHLNTLTKNFNHERITQPTLSSEEDFKKVYESFVIKPYLRYLEVIDFVYNRTGLQKYQKLASWMGFESELAFQEKIALKILPELKGKAKQLSDNVSFLEKHLRELMNGQEADEKSIISFCNEILKTHKIAPASKSSDLWKEIEKISKSKTSSTVAVKVSKLTEIEVSLAPMNIDDVLIKSVEEVQKAITELAKEQQLIQKIDIIDLYTQAWEIINKTTEAQTNCPVCGKGWEKEKLLEHIKTELSLLKKIKEEKDEVTRNVNSKKALVRREQEIVKQLIWKYEEAQKIIPSITYEQIKKYQTSLSILETSLGENVFAKGIQCPIKEEDILNINTEKEAIIKQVNKERIKLQPDKNELKLGENIEKLNQIKDKWGEILDAKDELQFFEKEVERFVSLGNALIKLIQENIKGRFGEISARIGKYFSILRSDKDIKEIEILLNEESGRAAGRSAEIQLSYYDIAVKPAYKVLSESLLNSLGLAVYFTCVKQFNEECKFIVLDDIMNSLDIENRDTILDLIEQEFADYQIILFTHDYYWFQKIMRRFPQWISKKIKGWDYKTGSKIDFAKTTREEVEELLSDSTTVEDAGFKFGKHIEGILNELCENLQAEVRHRYTKNDPPSMEELFDALYKRLKGKVGQNPVVEKVLNAKKYEPSIRNFSGHPRGNYPSTISPVEVRRAMQEWYALEEDLWCSDCHRYVEYHRTKDSIECRGGHKKLKKVVEVSPKQKTKGK